MQARTTLYTFDSIQFYYNMKFTVITSRKGNWMNGSTRHALGISVYSKLKVIRETKEEEVTICKAPRNRLNVLNDAFYEFGVPAIALQPSVMSAIGLRKGDFVEVYIVDDTFADAAVDKDESDKDESDKVLFYSSSSSLAENIRKLAKGDVMKGLSYSFMKSGRYEVAKKLGIKLEKVSIGAVRRTE